MISKYTAVVLGPTGLIGEQLVQILLKDPHFTKVILLTRRKIHLSDPKLTIRITDFSNLEAFRQSIGKGDFIFCCIGTTQKNVNGDMLAYRKVDVDIPVHAAQMAKDAGFSKYMLVSAVGASPRSRNFYLKMKGEVENSVAHLQFAAFHTFRPSMLLGQRKEFRLGEQIGKIAMRIFSFLFIGAIRKYKAIHAKQVAMAMVNASLTEIAGMVVHHYEDMIALSNKQMMNMEKK